CTQAVRPDTDITALPPEESRCVERRPDDHMAVIAPVVGAPRRSPTGGAGCGPLLRTQTGGQASLGRGRAGCADRRPRVLSGTEALTATCPHGNSARPSLRINARPN